MTKDESKYIYIIKSFGIFSVVCAHVSNVNSESNLVYLMSKILENLGSLGVPIFYFFSGYFFSQNKIDFFNFMKKKFLRIVIPWLFTGSSIYLYMSFRRGNISLKEWFFWVVGYKTYLYFLTNLFFFYIYFYILKKFKKIFLVTIFLGVLSLTLTAFNYLNCIVPYLNPFNFIIYFTLGILIKKKFSLDILKVITNKFKYIALILYVLLVDIILKFNISEGYFGKSTLLLQLLSFFIVLGFCQKKILRNGYIIDMGKKSFGIYLIHMPIAVKIVNIFNQISFLEYFTFLRPFLVLYLTKLIIDIYINILEKTKFRKKLSILIGV